MKVLPPVFAPWPECIDRRHNPQAAQGRYGYRAYRQCLRWEFGFTCAFCLCHEADLSLHGVEGTGLTQIEHFVPVSHNEQLTNNYANCFYICRFCNRARDTKPNIDPQTGGRLLNPCDSVWGDMFYVDSGEIKPIENSADVVYTSEAYELNDPRKIKLRLRRQHLIQESLDLVERGKSLRERLLEKATHTADPELVEAASFIEGRIKRAWRNLELFQTIPQDARSPCACQDEGPCSLPRVLDEQTLDIDPSVTM